MVRGQRRRQRCSVQNGTGEAFFACDPFDGIGDPAGEDRRNNVFFAEFVVGDQIGNRVRGGELHTFADAARTAAQRAFEKAREAKHVVDLVRIVGPSGCHDACFENSGFYCERVVKTKRKLLIPDARADEEWKESPAIKLDMISYLGCPITLPSGKSFGTICVLDRKCNEYTAVIEKIVLNIRDVIESELELLYVNQTLGSKNKRLADYLMKIQTLGGFVQICSHCKAIKSNKGEWTPIDHYLIKHPKAVFSHGICPSCMKILYPDCAQR